MAEGVLEFCFERCFYYDSTTPVTYDEDSATLRMVKDTEDNLTDVNIHEIGGTENKWSDPNCVPVLTAHSRHAKGDAGVDIRKIKDADLWRLLLV